MSCNTNLNHGKRFIAIFMISIMVGIVISMRTLPLQSVQAEEATIVSLSASYSGEAVMLGKEIDLSKLTVSATYNDGVTNEIKDYTIVSKIVKDEGTNLLMVIYQGKTANFYVSGKKLIKLSAYYQGGIVSIGNSVGKKDVKVYAEFGNGTTSYLTEFELHSNEITKVGQNEIYVSCEGQALKISVWGVAPKEVTALYATYSGGSVTVGNSIKREELVVTAAYKDGSSEIINNYVLTPEVLGATGTQTMVATYQGKTVSISVVGAYKEIKGITVKYLGKAIGVGHSVRPSDVLVTATYNDGTTSRLTEFNLLSSTISYIGYQVVTAEAGGFKAEFIVEGISEQVIDFKSANEFAITNGTNTGKVYVALPPNVDKKSLSGGSINNSLVSKVLTRTVRKSTYITFVIEENSEDVIEEFPLTMKIELPKEFALSNTSLYFTPNRKSVIGKMNVQSLAPNLLIVEIYNPGTYILVYNK
jgi:hypothetical protein